MKKSRSLIESILKTVPSFRSGFVFISVAIVYGTLVSSSILAQNPTTLIYQKDSLKADLKDLREVILNSHQNPFLYLDSLDFESVFLEADSLIVKDMSLADFSAVVGQSLQRLKDSHTVINFQKLFGYLKKDDALNLYFTTAIAEEKVIIRKDYLERLPDGAEILSINGITTNEVRRYMDPYKFYEGNSINQTNKLIGGLFSRVFSMRYGVRDTNSIVYVHNSKLDSLEYPSTTFKNIKKDKKSKTSKPFDLQFTDSVAYLKISSFGSGSDAKFSRFLKKSFKKINRENSPHLAIDLRNNLGGSVWRMEQVFTYLNCPDIISPEVLILNKSELSSKKYITLTKGFMGWVRLKFFRKSEKMNIFRTLAALPVGETYTATYTSAPEKAKKLYKGNLHLFTNYASGSASVLFTSSFKKNELGPIYGTSCLGPMSGTWGDPTPYKLRRSALWINLSVLRLDTFKNNEDYSPESIAVDHEVDKTILDFQLEIDPVKEKLEQIISQK